MLASALQVVELELEMTDAMVDIYEALTELLDSCIQELRRSNKIDSTQLTLENGLFKSFDEIVRQQLDSVWHTVSTKTKQVAAACCGQPGTQRDVWSILGQSLLLWLKDMTACRCRCSHFVLLSHRHMGWTGSLPSAVAQLGALLFNTFSST